MWFIKFILFRVSTLLQFEHHRDSFEDTKFVTLVNETSVPATVSWPSLKVKYSLNKILFSDAVLYSLFDFGNQQNLQLGAKRAVTCMLHFLTVCLPEGCIPALTNPAF